MSATIPGVQIIGRLTAAAISNVSTVQAGSLMNFDFSLVKINAPAELMPLGQSLSNKRREKAESGPIHILARRLGALFDGLVEETPVLLRAYGIRASSIASVLSEKAGSGAGGYNNGFRSGGSSRPSKQYGVFSNDAGVDGTTIWAAATSGPTALRLHLLACMLARLWSPQEATAIWVELVHERQRELREESERNGFIASQAHAAAHIPIEESQLSDWDASARAWILSADKAMQLQQTQLMLIINNLSLNVDSDDEPVYHSVISVWRRAMIAMEKLVGGTGQSVESGAVLLGLSAWHLYPDLLVLGVKSVEIYQRDELVGQGGLLTVGLSAATSEAEGIHWSLPLASLRYYGGPAYTRRTTRQDSTRLSIPQLQLVAMGALLAHWNNSSITPDDFARLIVVLWKTLKAASEQQPSAELKLKITTVLRVLDGLIQGATEFLDNSHEAVHRRFALQLLGYGKRHGQRWLGLSRAGEPPVPKLFGLNNMSSMIRFLQPEARVALLRDSVAKIKFPESARVLIRYKPPVQSPEIGWEFALPTAIPIKKAYESGTESPVESESSSRFIVTSHESSYKTLSHDFIEQYRNQRIEACGEDFQFVPTYWGDFIRQKGPQSFALLYNHGSNKPLPATEFETPPPAYYSIDSEVSPETAPEDFGSRTVVFLNLIFGNRQIAGVYSDLDPEEVASVSEVDIQQICKYLEGAGTGAGSGHANENTKLESSIFDLNALVGHLTRVFNMASSLGDSLLALATVSDLYTRYLPDATVSMAITNTPLKEAKWYHRATDHSRPLSSASTSSPGRRPSSQGGTPTTNPLPTTTSSINTTSNTTLTRLEMFSCILQMESGTINADPLALSNVFAISSGNSLFVTAQLLEDPHTSLPTDSVVHIIGNIGKAGIALLIPPSNQPRVREVELGEWEVIVHAPFDGEKQFGLFDSTSMHLSPTGYELNYDTGTHGLRGRQAFFVETRIAVHDRGKWVADVDPLAALTQRNLQRYTPKPGGCQCRSGAGRGTSNTASGSSGRTNHYHDKHQNDDDNANDIHFHPAAPPTRSSTNTNFAPPSTPPHPSLKANQIKTSIDCWEELLDLPTQNETGVVRAGGSWMARIAAVSISLQKGDCIILPPPTRGGEGRGGEEEGEAWFCWECFDRWRTPAHRSTRSNLDLSSVPLKTVVFIW